MTKDSPFAAVYEDPSLAGQGRLASGGEPAVAEAVRDVDCVKEGTLEVTSLAASNPLPYVKPLTVDFS